MDFPEAMEAAIAKSRLENRTAPAKWHNYMEFTVAEKARVLWYDIYLFLLLALECDYRKYETDEIYKWATEMLAKYMDIIKNHLIKTPNI